MCSHGRVGASRIQRTLPLALDANWDPQHKDPVTIARNLQMAEGRSILHQPKPHVPPESGVSTRSPWQVHEDEGVHVGASAALSVTLQAGPERDENDSSNLHA